jgi:steroid 5-alpha reductase family enzyme
MGLVFWWVLVVNCGLVFVLFVGGRCFGVCFVGFGLFLVVCFGFSVCWGIRCWLVFLGWVGFFWGAGFGFLGFFSLLGLFMPGCVFIGLLLLFTCYVFVW